MSAAPQPGQVVRVRSRQYLVEDVVPPPAPADQTLVRLSCLDDDSQGTLLQVLWEKELDAQVLSEASWKDVARKGFDPPQLFSAYLHALRWNCVTATDPTLFQAPLRAGIQVLNYQLEPLRMALRLPRVNLFIADDVGLGKTIEAGLILREMLLRQKIRRVVVAAPAGVVPQWKEELESRFGLTFAIFDRQYVLEKRRERGIAINPWDTHTRFLISHSLLRDEAYAAPLRDWLHGDGFAGSMLILDEAHNAAPSSGSRYAIDSQLTRVIRDLASKFEHRLFLSATPHNGHSNSFSALLEMLDPQRFCRGIPVAAKLRDQVLVRRIKEDIRDVEGGFPKRETPQIDIDKLPADAPELVLSERLAEYRSLRAERLDKSGAKKSVQAASALVVISLQKRLLSSIEAFACTLRVHRKAVERQAASAPVVEYGREPEVQQLSLLDEQPGPDDERADLPEEEVRAEEEAEVEVASSIGGSASKRERELLEEMTEIADAARGLRDPRTRKIEEWIRKNQCPNLGKADAAWTGRRLLIFTEYADTKRYLEEQLRGLIAKSDRAEDRLATLHGGMGEKSRKRVKDAFNSDPSSPKNPLRILIATDAAREGINLQNHCSDLFHFDVPWNPGRMEQRNGRIDRKLQREPVVRCHYFVFKQRPEDRVLETLVRKTGTIQKELGSLSQVLERRLGALLKKGIAREEVEKLQKAIDGEVASSTDVTLVAEELESARKRKEALTAELDALRTLLAKSHDHLGFDTDNFRNALSSALVLLKAPPLEKANGDDGTLVFPPLDRNADPTWAFTLDSIRTPRDEEQSEKEWRRVAPLRPIVFEAPKNLDDRVVHLHLEHRVVQRLLGRFLAQGFVHHDLSRACVGMGTDPVPRVILYGRLSLYGEGAARLHDELVPIAAKWSAADSRKEPLKPYAAEAERKTRDLLEKSLISKNAGKVDPTVQKKLLASAERDVRDLLPHLDARAKELAAAATEKLFNRGKLEAEEMKQILAGQKKRIEQQIVKHDKQQEQYAFKFEGDDRRQVEADRKAWDRRMQDIVGELESEPARIQRSYVVKASRIEPVGIVYLYPVSG